MPSYKTHSIHGEIVLSQMPKQIHIDNDDMKTFCIGPDTLVSTDYRVFDIQHSSKTKNYFEALLKTIKRCKLQDNKEVMAFLYGQIDHFVLDSTVHPFIYYITEKMPKKHLLHPHTLVEMWIDDYTSLKYNKNELIYYRKLLIKDGRLRRLIDEVYKKIYNAYNESLKYEVGVIPIALFDTIIRRNILKIIPSILKTLNIGDIVYHKDDSKVIPFLNKEHNLWLNPETKEEYQKSFDELWKKSLEVACETIDDINAYLYFNKKLVNPLITNNISYNTGIKCEEGQKLRYLKKYFD